MKNLNVIFYGIGRANVRRRNHYIRLIEILHKNYNLNIIEILNNISKISNSRSNEFSNNFKNEFILKKSTKVLKVFLNSNKVKKLLKVSKKFTDVHSDNYKSVSNLLQQLSMLEESTKYLKPGLVLAIRDDLLFNEKLLVSYIEKTSVYLSLNKKTFLTSFFHSNTGICERIFFGSYENAKHILLRINLIESYFKELNKLSYIKKKGLNGEWLMKFIVEKNNFTPFCVPIFTKRLRINHTENESLFSHPKHWIYEKTTFIGLLRFLKLKCLNQFS